MLVGPNQWVARCQKMASKPLPLSKAKTAALQQALHGLYHYSVADPVVYLNNLTIRSLRKRASTEGEAAERGEG
jgi:hypothetical protein